MRHCDIVAEIGINHNGSLETAKKLMDVAVAAGCDYVKFQKRTPALCVPEEQKGVMRETPWGRIPYLDYKERIEFSMEEYEEINRYAQKIGIEWFASVWDNPSLDFINQFDVPYIKIPSALNEKLVLIADACETGKHVIVSTGMLEDVSALALHGALYRLAQAYTLMHSVSGYPVEDHNADLSCIRGLRELKITNIGYSDHTRGIHMAVAAVGMGATMIEKHITLDRTMWGTDQAASIEPQGLEKMVRNIRGVCSGWGKGVFTVRECEAEAKRRLKG